MGHFCPVSSPTLLLEAIHQSKTNLQIVLIVDGNNLMWAWERTRRLLVVKEWSEARRVLLQAVQCYVGQGKQRAIIVFDGMPDGIPQGTARSRARVIFSEGKETADDVIVRLVKADKAPGELLVVSSDKRDIVHAVRYRGAQTMGSGTFAQCLEDSLQEPVANEKPDAMSKSEVAEWLEKFGRESQ